MRTPEGFETPFRASQEPTVVLDDQMMRRSDALKKMMGIARMIVADDVVTDREASLFRDWLSANKDLQGLPAMDEIVMILTNAFDDGRLTLEDRETLREALERFGG